MNNLSAEVLDLLEAGDSTPTQEESPGWCAQLSYLNSCKGGEAAIADAGIRPRTRRAWKTRTPNTKNQERIHRAYWQLRATNCKRTGHTRPRCPCSLGPTAEGMGPPQADDHHPRRLARRPDTGPGRPSHYPGTRDPPSNRRWDHLIDTWATGDETKLDTAWMDFASEIDSPPGLYDEVAHIGFVL